MNSGNDVANDERSSGTHVPLSELIKASPPQIEKSDSADISTSKPKRRRDRKRGDSLDKSLKQMAELDVTQRQHEINRANVDHKQLVRLRWILGISGLAIVIAWQYMILDIVKTQGGGGLVIPTSVLLALVTTTTVNVFGFLYIVMHFVFPKSNPPRSKNLH